MVRDNWEVRSCHHSCRATRPDIVVDDIQPLQPFPFCATFVHTDIDQLLASGLLGFFA
jgi:hypothetical protein